MYLSNFILDNFSVLENPNSVNQMACFMQEIYRLLLQTVLD